MHDFLLSLNNLFFKNVLLDDLLLCLCQNLVLACQNHMAAFFVVYINADLDPLFGRWNDSGFRNFQTGSLGSGLLCFPKKIVSDSFDNYRKSGPKSCPGLSRHGIRLDKSDRLGRNLLLAFAWASYVTYIHSLKNVSGSTQLP